jgi:hypothetical protein
MYSYPLKFKTDDLPADSELSIIDAEKNDIIYRTKITENMKAGKEPCILFTDKTSKQPLFRLYITDSETEKGIKIKSTNDNGMGELVLEKEHLWKVMDESGSQIASIEEKAAWKNSCLFQLLTLPLDKSDEDVYLKMLFPHRYLLKVNGKKAMELRERVSTLSDDYTLKKSGDFSEREETLMLVSMISVLGFKE